MPEEFLPTAVAMTAAALASPKPAEATPTPEPTPTSSPTATPTSPPTPTPTHAPEAPQAAIRVLAPGPMSKVVSPIVLKAYVKPGDEGQIRVELLGEDGRLLQRYVFNQPTLNVEGAYVSMKIPFEVRAAAELGRLQIVTEDEFGRPQNQAAVHLLLLSVGDSELNPADAPYERCVFYEPQAYGGTLILNGEIQPFNETPVIFEIVDEAGKVLGLRVLTFEGGNREPFGTTIAYKVTEQTSARLIVRQADDRISGLIYLHSQEIILNP